MRWNAGTSAVLRTLLTTMFAPDGCAHCMFVSKKWWMRVLLYMGSDNSRAASYDYNYDYC